MKKNPARFSRSPREVPPPGDLQIPLLNVSNTKNLPLDAEPSERRISVDASSYTAPQNVRPKNVSIVDIHLKEKRALMEAVEVEKDQDPLPYRSPDSLALASFTRLSEQSRNALSAVVFGSLSKKSGNGSDSADTFGDEEAFTFSDHFPMDDLYLHGDYSPASFRAPNDLGEDPYTEGMEPFNINVEAYHRTRSSFSFFPFAPSKFTKPAQPNLVRPDQLPEHTRVFGVEELFSGRKHPPYVRCIVVCDRPDINPQYLFRAISAHQALDQLYLRNLSLSLLPCDPPLPLPYLLVLDLSRNNLGDIRMVQKFINRLPNLEILNISENPIMGINDWKLMLIVANLNLKTINGHAVTIDEKSAAVEKYGTAEQRGLHAHWRFDWVMNVVAKNIGMDVWEPLKIGKLPLSKLKLQVVHVGTFVNLQFLDVSHNLLKTLEGMGLEQLVNLKSLNVANNQIGSPQSINVLAYIPRLQEVWFAGNPLSEHRMRIVYVTLNLRGTNRNLGIQEIDGTPVGMSEKLQSLRMFGRVSEQQLEVARWNMIMIHLFGHIQLRTLPNFHSRIKTLDLSGLSLSFVDLRNFEAVQFLDLSNNQVLHTVLGIERIARLRYLDVSGNPHLNLKTIGQALAQMVATGGAKAALQSLVFFHDFSESQPQLQAAKQAPVAEKQQRKATKFFKREQGEKNQKGDGVWNSQQYQRDRFTLLCQLLPFHHALRALDNVPISVDERCNVWKALGRPDAEIEQMRFRLGCLISSTEPTGRSFDPLHLSPSVQYDPQIVTTLHLSNLKLNFFSCDFSNFPNLELLNLSGNSINDLLAIPGLDKCGKLEVADFSMNQIQNDLSALSRFLDHFKRMHTVSLRHNPSVRSPSDRSKLLAQIQRMKTLETSLKVLDTLVTPDERIALKLFPEDSKQNLNVGNENFSDQKGGKKSASVWKSSEEKWIELFRFQAWLYLKSKFGEAAEQIRLLDLSRCSLRAADLSPFKSLEILLLNDNKLFSLSDINVRSCQKLRVLDLRNNELKSLKECAELAENLPLIQSVGFCGNKFSKNEKKYRMDLISLIPKLKVPTCLLYELDSQVVTVDEICEAWLRGKGAAETLGKNVVQDDQDGEDKPGGDEEEGLGLMLAAKTEWANVAAVSHSNELKRSELMPAIERFRFAFVMHKKGCQPQTTRGLNLQSTGLTYFDLSKFSESLIKISLRGNNITDENLIASGIQNCTKLQILDLSENKISDPKTVAQIADKLPELQILEVAGNPFFPSASDANSRESFLRLIKNMQYVLCPLKVLNGSPITIQERCRALKKATDETSVELLRFDLLCNEMDVDPLASDRLVAVNQDLVIIRGASRYLNIKVLDLQSNYISSIQDAYLHALPNLQYLDLRKNAIENFAQTFSCLRKCPKLKFLYLEGAGNGFESKADYFREILRSMRNLDTLDGIKNPFPFTADQQQAADYLCTKFDISPNDLLDIDLSRAGLKKAQFWSVLIALATLISERKHAVAPGSIGWDVGNIVGPEKLKLLTSTSEEKKNFNGEAIPEYRFLVVYHLSTLQILDDHDVSIDEQENAERMLEQLRANLAKQQQVQKDKNENENEKNSSDPQANQIQTQTPFKGDKLTLASVRTGEKAAMGSGGSALDITTHQNGASASVGEMSGTPASGEGNAEIKEAFGAMEAGAVTAGAALSVGFDYIEQNAMSLSSIGQFQSALASRVYDIQSLGTFLSKAEILLSFLQIFAVVFNFQVPWPEMWLNAFRWVVAFNFDFEVYLPRFDVQMQYIKFAIVMCAPLFALYLYSVKLNKARWTKFYVHNWTQTKLKYFGIWFGTSWLSLLVGYLSDLQSFVLAYHKKPPTQATISVFLVLFVGVTALWFLFYLNAKLYRKWRDDQRAWMQYYNRHRQRVALFLVTVMYMPVCRTVFVTFQCDANRTQLLYFDGQHCPTSLKDAPPMWFIAFFFGLLYIAGIPLFFARLIAQGSRIIEADYSLSVDDQELQNLRENLKQLKREKAKKSEIKEAQKKIKEKEEFVKNKYANAVTTFKSASSYLYSSYERRLRYYKIFQMSEKMILLVVALFAANQQEQFKTLVGTGVVAGYAAIASFLRPFSDNLEDWSDIVARVCNTLNSLLGFVLVKGFDLPPWFSPGFALVIINGVNVAWLCLNSFFIFPIRMWLRDRATKLKLAALKEAASKLEDSEEKMAEVAATLGQDVHGDLEEEEEQLLQKGFDFSARDLPSVDPSSSLAAASTTTLPGASVPIGTEVGALVATEGGVSELTNKLEDVAQDSSEAMTSALTRLSSTNVVSSVQSAFQALQGASQSFSDSDGMVRGAVTRTTTAADLVLKYRPENIDAPSSQDVGRFLNEHKIETAAGVAIGAQTFLDRTAELRSPQIGNVEGIGDARDDSTAPGAIEGEL